MGFGGIRQIVFLIALAFFTWASTGIATSTTPAEVTETASPATFSGPGQTLHVTFTFQYGGYDGFTSVYAGCSGCSSGSNLFPQGTTLDSCVQSGSSGAFVITCTKDYTTTASDVTLQNVSDSGSYTVTRPNNSQGDPQGSIGMNIPTTIPLATFVRPVITFSKPADQPFSTGSITVSATASSNLPVQFSSGDDTICTVSGNTVTFVATGACTILADQPGDSTHAPAYQVSQTFQITGSAKTANSITFNALSDKVYGSGSFTVSATADGGTTTFSSTTGSICSVTGGNTVNLLGVGQCTIQASNAGDATYAAATDVSRSFNITQASNTITFNALSDKVYGSGSFTVSASATSGTTTFSSTTSATCSVTGGNTVNLISVGQCTIKASNSGSTNYAAATDVSRSFNITQASNTITFAQPADHALGSGTFNLGASASSGLAVSYASSTTSFCTVTSGGTVTLVAVGTCTIQVTQAGDSNYLAATPVSHSFQVLVAVTNVVLATSASTDIQGFPLTLTATVTGVGPTGTVTFFDGSTNLGTAPLSGVVATLTITPSVTGSHSYSASYGGDPSNGTSVSSPVSVAITAKPDPGKDPQTIGLVNSQVSSFRRFGNSQMGNIFGYTQGLHDHAHRHVFTSNVTLNGVPVSGTVNPVADTDPYSTPLHLWASGDVTFGVGGDTSTNFTTTGFTLGLDHEINQDLTAGIAFGIGADDTKFGTNGTRNQSSNKSVSLYADFAATPSTFFDVIAGYGQGSINANRWSTAGSVLLNGTRSASELFGSVGITHEQHFESLVLSPYAKLNAEKLMLDSYTETGGSPWALSYAAMDTVSVNGIAGGSASYPIPVSWGSLTAKAHAEYSASLMGDFTQNIAFADGIGSASSITDHGLSASQFNFGGGFDFSHDKMMGGIEYQYSLGADNTTAHSVRATLGFQF